MPEALAHEEETVAVTFPPASRSPDEKISSACYTNHTFEYDDGSTRTARLSPRCGSSCEGSKGVVLNVQDLETTTGASVVPSLQTYFRFRDLLLGDQTFYDDSPWLVLTDCMTNKEDQLLADALASLFHLDGVFELDGKNAIA